MSIRTKTSQIVKIINHINNQVGIFISYLFLPITIIAVSEVFMRYVLNKPTLWAWDLNMQLFAPLIVLGGGYTLLHEGHVAVDFLIMRWSPTKKARLELFTYSIVFFSMILILYAGTKLGIRSMIRGETTGTIWDPPLWTIKMWVPIGILFLLLQVASKILSNLLIVFPSKASTKTGV